MDQSLEQPFGLTNEDCVTGDIAKTGDKFALRCRFQS